MNKDFLENVKWKCNFYNIYLIYFLVCLMVTFLKLLWWINFLDLELILRRKCLKRHCDSKNKMPLNKLCKTVFLISIFLTKCNCNLANHIVILKKSKKNPRNHLRKEKSQNVDKQIFLGNNKINLNDNLLERWMLRKIDDVFHRNT